MLGLLASRCGAGSVAGVALASSRSSSMVGALENYQLCLRQSLDVPHDWYHFIVYSLAGIGDVAWVRGNSANAAQLPAASALLNVERGVLLSMGNPHEYLCFERSMAAAAEQRRDPLFEAAWQEGEKLARAEAVELALAEIIC